MKDLKEVQQVIGHNDKSQYIVRLSPFNNLQVISEGPTKGTFYMNSSADKYPELELRPYLNKYTYLQNGIVREVFGMNKGIVRKLVGPITGKITEVKVGS
jgi:hypothetical protein